MIDTLVGAAQPSLKRYRILSMVVEKSGQASGRRDTETFAALRSSVCNALKMGSKWLPTRSVFAICRMSKIYHPTWGLKYNGSAMQDDQ